MVSPSLLLQCKEGHESAYKALYEACIRYVLSIVRTYIADESDHADLIQDIFAQVFHKLHLYEAERGEFKYWLRKITVNQCLMKLRKKDFFFGVLSLDKYSEIEVEDKQDAFYEHIHQLSKKDIEALIYQMPEGYKTVFLLVAIDEYSHEEVGKLLGINSATSRSQYHKARRWIQQHIVNTNNKKKYGLSF